jgi:WD40 repeat protein
MVIAVTLMMSGCTGPKLVRTVVSEQLVCQIDSRSIDSPIIYSPDAGRVAYIAEKAGKEFAVIDGVAGKGYSSIHIDLRMFSPDSKRVAYRAVNYGEKPPAGNKWFVVIDGEEGDEYQTADWVTFSPDSKRVAYLAEGGVYLDRVQVTSPGATVCEDNSLLFSPDSEHLVYVIELNGKQSVVVDGVPGKQYDKIGTIVFSPDSKHLAYGAKTGNNWFIVADGIPGKPYDSIGDIVFSPDSKHLAYVARLGLGGPGARGFVVLDGVEGKQYESAHVINPAFNLAFSPDSNHLAYAVEGKPTYITRGLEYTGFVIVDGEVKEITEGNVQRLLFSPDSKRLAYVELLPPGMPEPRYFIVVDGEKGKKYEYIDDFVFSPDSKHVIYIVIHGVNMFVVVDHTEGTEYGFLDSTSVTSSAEDLGIKRIVFDSADRFHYLVEKGDSIYLVEETLKLDQR